MKLLEKIEKEQFKAETQHFEVGDSVSVHTKVVEGTKERIQVFRGIVLARSGRGMNAMFTVRRISFGEGVERIFPLHSPRLQKIVVDRQGKVRRAKIYYMRGRKGRNAILVKEKVKPKTSAKKKTKS